MDTKKQGIVSILVSDSDTQAAKATSLRRTLSTDMSLTQLGFMLSPLKKSPSSHEFPVSSSFEEGEDDNEAPSQPDVWASIQRKKKEEVENQGQLDVWSSIVSQKAVEEASNSSPPYIHPLVKRSGSCLSKKSLEICTESLGSETGFDGFSSETDDMEEDKREDQQLLYQKQEPVAPMVMPCFHGEKEAIIAKHNYDVGKKTSNPSFPPPISSLPAKDGASRRLKTRRDNGRLVIEAVSTPCLNNFLAQRQDGRLVLTFANTNSAEKEVMEVEELEEEFESFGVKESEIDIDEEGEESQDRFSEIKEAPKLSSEAINVHRLAVMMNKPMWSANRNPTWPKDINGIVKFGDEKEGKVKPTAPPQSLPPHPPVSRPISAVAGAGTVVSLNAYECYRRRPNQGMSKGQAAAALDQQSQAMKGKIKGDEFVPLLKRYKEHRRSLLFWPPHCIATS
ncbi:U-box domain-containing protein 23 [Hibiscus syriacus]|uniref:U-box domain-containing protein 23 n=2 Tax=Hibiscus syriacus TaxID=106335 RepID=A0A6A3D8Q4_HIBSY|nr:U-box domain-containing protein 23 [Hibiscus syriacus]